MRKPSFSEDKSNSSRLTTQRNKPGKRNYRFYQTNLYSVHHRPPEIKNKQTNKQTSALPLFSLKMASCLLYAVMLHFNISRHFYRLGKASLIAGSSCSFCHVQLHLMHKTKSIIAQLQVSYTTK